MLNIGIFPNKSDVSLKFRFCKCFICFLFQHQNSAQDAGNQLMGKLELQPRHHGNTNIGSHRFSLHLIRDSMIGQPLEFTKSQPLAAVQRGYIIPSGLRFLEGYFGVNYSVHLTKKCDVVGVLKVMFFMVHLRDPCLRFVQRTRILRGNLSGTPVWDLLEKLIKGKHIQTTSKPFRHIQMKEC